MKPPLRSRKAKAAGLFLLGTSAIALVLAVALREMTAPAFVAAAHLGPLPKAVPARVAEPSLGDDGPRADKNLDRSGYTLAGSGALFVPKSFRSKDGSFDLLVHFHGNAELVAESVEAAGLSAVLLVVNLGIGSAAYDNRYAIPAYFDYDLARALEVLASRGLEKPTLRRLALSAWSAGYGGIVRLLQSPRLFEQTTAVLLCDAMHANLKDKHTRAVDLDRIDPFIRFAKEASLGKKLFVMTHSEVGEFRYATTTETSSALLASLGIFRDRKVDFPERPAFPLARHVMSTEAWLEQRTEAQQGNLHVTGFKGFKEDDHIAHLAQMSTTVLPELVAYWAEPKERISPRR